MSHKIVSCRLLHKIKPMTIWNGFLVISIHANKAHESHVIKLTSIQITHCIIVMEGAALFWSGKYFISYNRTAAFMRIWWKPAYFHLIHSYITCNHNFWCTFWFWNINVSNLTPISLRGERYFLSITIPGKQVGWHQLAYRYLTPLSTIFDAINNSYNLTK